ncbi:interferon-related developmental regulator-domain-containing protein [Podospora appendiculata]|uniref:Interferon-related developmental regulator-domain-containing protein n=1 Tax=Podospora appendiculata TaxID=314037 RepID=A0AAE0X627_9PEZI|nr:interferon-related developmental regulator-domain-containing protein [Podospora appendiculata]
MHDLRKKALLESGKTLSRKARSNPSDSPNGSPGSSRPGSQANSRAASRVNSQANSRAGSRYASEDEGMSEPGFDDGIPKNLNRAGYVDSVSDDDDESLDEDEDEDDQGNVWIDRLQHRVAELKDRKRSSVQGREKTLAAYLHIIRYHFAQRQIESQLPDIIPALLRSVKTGSSTEEVSLALLCLAVTILTCPSENFFDNVSSAVMTVCKDSKQERVKVTAVHTLSVAVAFGGGSVDAATEIRDFFLEVVESDGKSVKADDSAAVVTAALKAWAFLATQLEWDDLSSQSDQAMEVFIDQLDSTDSNVQINAGTNLALLFEAARDHEEETGDKINLQHYQHKILARLAEISRDNPKSVSKKERRDLRANVASIITSLERGKGPNYSTASWAGINPHTGGENAHNQAGEEFGYRQKIGLRNQVVVVETWSLSVIAETLRVLLGGGLTEHLERNLNVKELAPELN